MNGLRRLLLVCLALAPILAIPARPAAADTCCSQCDFAWGQCIARCGNPPSPACELPCDNNFTACARTCLRGTHPMTCPIP